MTYWEHTGAYTAEFNELHDRLVPPQGRARTVHGELLSSISRVYYDWYNNGGCNLELPRFQFALYTIRSWAEEIDAQSVLDQREFVGTKFLVDRLLKWSRTEDGKRKFGLEAEHEKHLELLVDKIVMLVKAEDEKLRENPVAQ